MKEAKVEKKLLWVSSSKRDLIELPADVKSDFGFGLYQAQIGLFPDIGKPLKGFPGVTVVELKLDFSGDTYRGIYTIQFEDAVVVLHVFKKKSNKGKETPKKDKELVKGRIKLAKEVYNEWKKKSNK